MTTKKKAIDLTSYINKTLKDTIYDLCVNLHKEHANTDICLSIYDIDDHILYHETASIVRKTCSADNLKDGKNKFYSTMEDIMLRRRVNLEVDRLIVSEVRTKICKVRNKDEKYIRLDIVVDGNPTLEEALEYIIDHKLYTAEIVVNDINNATMSTITINFNISDKSHLINILNKDMLNKKLSRYPEYKEDLCVFFIKL